VSTPLLIEPDALHAALQQGGCVPVDCRFRLMDPGAGEAAYAGGHIPGARYMHLDRDLASAPAADEGRHPLPEPSELARTLSRLGISNSDYVVAYDDAGGAIAARLWWLLRWIGHARVSVLNGGLKAWQNAGLTLQAEAPEYAPGQFRAAAPDPRMSVATADVAAELAAGSVLIDARSAERFAGRSEPIDPVAGHVPGAVNCPFERLLAVDGRVREPAALRRLFVDELNLKPDDRIVAMCGSGVTACHVLLALEQAGIDGGRLYAGSWSEWIRDPARPVATGSGDVPAS
jgi:thiosulfate/3-mercaptopyruvate sulfurtransferase